MVGAVLDVVEFHDELAAVDAVVVVAGAVGAAGPDEAVVVQAGIPDYGEALFGYGGRDAVDIFGDEG